MLASEYGWKLEEILEMKISVLAKMSDVVRDRKDAEFLSNSLVVEWQTRTTVSVIAATAQDESGKFKKGVDKIRFPWAEFGYPEVLEQQAAQQEFDLSDLSYLEGAGDTSAADKNSGKELPAFLGGGLM